MADSIDDLEKQVRALRLAQSLAMTIRASAVPETEWGVVLEYLSALLKDQRDESCHPQLAPPK